ncbi:hypothetical protein BH10BAC4_BH10BAC4_03810 [soil metagenome]
MVVLEGQKVWREMTGRQKTGEKHIYAGKR